MTDVFTKTKRSEVMSRIRGRGNKDTELALAGLLRANRISGWRRHVVVRATVESSRLRVESGRKRTSPRPAPQKNVFPRRPSPGFATLSRSHGGGTRRGEGAQRQRISPPSTINPQLTVRPDFVFRQVRLALFVDGCFWHCCPKHATKPKNNRAFWRRKLAGNQARDALVTRTLRKAGWRVLRVWEHELARIKTASTPHPNPLPVRSGEGAEARLVRRIQRALNH